MLQTSAPSKTARPVADPRFSGLGEAISAAIKPFGLDFFMACEFPRHDRPRLSDNIIATNWPRGAFEPFGSDAEDRIIRRLRESIYPVRTESLFGSAAAGCEVDGIYLCERFKDTLAVSIFDPSRHHYALIMSGPAAIDDDRMGTLLLALMRVFDHHSKNSDRAQSLTLRELQCLSWSAAGKSTDETAIILDLSAHTVNGYLKTAIRKLNAVNRTQAVASAVRLGLI